jgi:hypothetical protein
MNDKQLSKRANTTSANDALAIEELINDLVAEIERLEEALDAEKDKVADLESQIEELLEEGDK